MSEIPSYPWPYRPGPGHRYLSTACVHQEHDLCRLECKFCKDKCCCECHRRISTQRGTR